MKWLLYLRLFYLTAGTLLPFFWMVVILGHRRQRNFERIFFFLCLAFVCFFGSSLLAVNAQLHYRVIPGSLVVFTWSVLCLGLWFIPALVVHLHAEYAALRGLLAQPNAKRMWVLIAYLPVVLLSPQLVGALRLRDGQDFVRPTHLLGLGFQLWLIASTALAAFWQRRFSKLEATAEERALYTSLKWQFLALLVLLPVSVWLQRRLDVELVAGIGPALLVLTIMGPFLTILKQVNRFNFLAIGRQRNLIYAVTTMFVALLYLSLVRRAGQWVEPYLPPEATAALLLFLPVVFFEPLQRLIRQLLRQTAQSEMDRAQKLMGPINEAARLGDSQKLSEFAEKWIGEQLQLADVQVEMRGPNPASDHRVAAKTSSEEVFAIGRAGKHQGRLRVRAHGAMISGETYAALEFVAEQLPAAFDLCHLIEEKLQLERELAERERMALVGQMAASISHNLKNPLGSIKTILQVQMESAELPRSLREETQMVLDEINRLSGKLNQLLQFSRPGVRPSSKSERCNVFAVATNVAEVLRREAESRGVALKLEARTGACEVLCSAESTNDILSNVVLNAIEAASRAGRVNVAFACQPPRFCTVAVEDDGEGVAPGLREKILQPFFTTKPRGTGLGLAIVARRLEEIGGRLEIDSPLIDGHGTRFRLEFPLAPKEAAK
jgi:signal transduction histidine kinase